MASLPPNQTTGYHTRSISLPLRANPSIPDINNHLRRLTSSEATTSLSSSLGDKLIALGDLYECVDSMLQLPHTCQLIAREHNKDWVEELLNSSLCFLDLSSTAKDVLTQTKEQAQELQSTSRRKGGNEQEMVKEAEKYLTSRIKAKEVANKSLRDLKSKCAFSSFNSKTPATFRMLRQVELVTVVVFESLFAFIRANKALSKQCVRSLISKLTNSSKRVTCDKEATALSEVEKVDDVLQAFVSRNNGKSNSLQTEDIQNELRQLELILQDLGEQLEFIARRLIRTRASILNSLNH